MIKALIVSSILRKASSARISSDQLDLALWAAKATPRQVDILRKLTLHWKTLDEAKDSLGVSLTNVRAGASQVLKQLKKASGRTNLKTRHLTIVDSSRATPKAWEAYPQDLITCSQLEWDLAQISASEDTIKMFSQSIEGTPTDNIASEFSVSRKDVEKNIHSIYTLLEKRWGMTGPNRNRLLIIDSLDPDYLARINNVGRILLPKEVTRDQFHLATMGISPRNAFVIFGSHFFGNNNSEIVAASFLTAPQVESAKRNARKELKDVTGSEANLKTIKIIDLPKTTQNRDKTTQNRDGGKPHISPDQK